MIAVATLAVPRLAAREIWRRLMDAAGPGFFGSFPQTSSLQEVEAALHPTGQLLSANVPQA